MKNQPMLGQAELRVMLVSLLVAAWNVQLAKADPGTEQFDLQMRPILDNYLQIGDALAADSMDEVNRNAESIAKLAKSLDPTKASGEHASHYEHVPAKLKAAAQTLAKSKTLEETRAAYKKLSMPMGMWAGMSKPEGIDVVYCPMAKARWVQRKGAIRNPYHGSEMLRCGQVVKAD